MTKFKWHLMADEVPDEGDGDYIVKKKHRDAFMFYASKVEYLPGGVCFYAPNRRDHLVAADTVHAWAEIPPLDETKRRCAECDYNLDMGTGIPFCLYWSESTEDDGFCHRFEPSNDGEVDGG